MELFYLADAGNPKMLERLKIEHVKNIKGMVVREQNFDEFAEYVIDKVIETVKANRKQIETLGTMDNVETVKKWEALSYSKYEVLGRSRVRPYAACRQIITYILKKFAPNKKTNYISLERIGLYVGGHHATVIHSIREVEKIMMYGVWKSVIDQCINKVENRWVKLSDIC